MVFSHLGGYSSVFTERAILWGAWPRKSLGNSKRGEGQDERPGQHRERERVWVIIRWPTTSRYKRKRALYLYSRSMIYEEGRGRNSLIEVDFEVARSRILIINRVHCKAGSKRDLWE